LGVPFEFEDGLFEDFGNTSNYLCTRKPSVPVPSADPIEATFLRENVRKLAAIVTSEWSRELELSLKVLRISSPPSTIPCTIRGTTVDILYSPTVGANIISSECAFQLLGDEPLVQTDKTFQTSSRKILDGIGILQNMIVRHEDVEVILDFHIFDVQDIDLMIGHPIEKLLMDATTESKLNVRLGKETFSVQNSRATNSMAEPFLDSEPIVEMIGILPVDSPESLLDKDPENFIEEEDDPAKPIDISKFKNPLDLQLS
jgi:hypothetical protein